MSDVYNKEKRSLIMSSVKSKGNKSTELKLISLLKDNNIVGWKRNYPVKGHPDFVFLKQKVAIFVDGCFWHGHICRKQWPKENEEFWRNKRERNIIRDLETTARFKKRGWIVLRIWECQLKKKNLPEILVLIQNALNKSNDF